MHLNSTGIPRLDCPSCGENILAKEFYNYCSEILRVREVNFAVGLQKRVYIHHDDDDRQSQDHECSLEAYCFTCRQRLPWPLSQLRGLNGLTPVGLRRKLTTIVRKSDSI
jgi:endogenous inhibitor of DNA gyrase (YacG/DUF329 family)